MLSLTQSPLKRRVFQTSEAEDAWECLLQFMLFLRVCLYIATHHLIL